MQTQRVFSMKGLYTYIYVKEIVLVALVLLKYHIIILNFIYLFILVHSGGDGQNSLGGGG